MQTNDTRSKGPWTEASKLQDAKRDLAAWACRWNRVRTRLLEKPRRLLELELGYELGPNVEVEVHEERDDHRYMVIPAWPAATPPEELVPGIVHAVARGVLHSESPLSASDRGVDETGVVSSDPELDIVARAWKDGEFRQRLRDQPTETLAETLNFEWPQGVGFQLLEESSEQLHVVIPARVEDPSEEMLDDQDLDSLELPLVAGSPTVILSVSALCD